MLNYLQDFRDAKEIHLKTSLETYYVDKIDQIKFEHHGSYRDELLLNITEEDIERPHILALFDVKLYPVHLGMVDRLFKFSKKATLLIGYRLINEEVNIVVKHVPHDSVNIKDMLDKLFLDDTTHYVYKEGDVNPSKETPIKINCDLDRVEENNNMQLIFIKKKC